MLKYLAYNNNQITVRLMIAQLKFMRKANEDIFNIIIQKDYGNSTKYGTKGVYTMWRVLRYCCH